MNRNGRAGQQAEREVAALLTDLLGVPARRALGAGRKDDVGDIHGVPSTVVQVTAMASLSEAATEKLPQVEAQRVNAGASFGALFCRRRGGTFVVVLTPEAWATLWREATSPEDTWTWGGPDDVREGDWTEATE